MQLCARTSMEIQSEERVHGENNVDQSESSKIGGEIDQVLDFLAEGAERMGEGSIRWPLHYEIHQHS